MTQHNLLRETHQSEDIKIHLYALCWNEERMLPYFFRYYDPLISKYFIYDNGSTDRSIEMLKANDRVSLGHFEVFGDSFVVAAQNYYNECWKQSREQTDWVIVCNIDEQIYHPNLKGYLSACKRKGISLVIPKGYDMVSDTFPRTEEPLHKIVNFGMRNRINDKPQVFNPTRISEINFAPGRHTARPTGEVTIPWTKKVKLLHFKFLGLEYLMRRHSELRDRLKPRDIERGLGHHYLWDEEMNTKVFQRAKSRAKRVIE
jgi:Glycosyl transferase family 2